MATRNKKNCEQKQPVMSSVFRMLVERMVAKFRDEPDKTLEFPTSLNKEQRDFVHNFVVKCQGLRTRTAGNGRNLNTAAFIDCS